MRSAIPVVLFAVLMGAAPAAKPQHWHDDNGHWNKHRQHHDDDDRDFDHRAGGCLFEPHDVRVINEYYAPRYRSLPPGLQKKLYRTGHLPPGWEKKVEPFPVAVERQLAPLPRGYRRGVVDGYAVVYDPGTRVIVDVTVLFGAR
jgi:hypothetical protein